MIIDKYAFNGCSELIYYMFSLVYTHILIMFLMAVMKILWLIGHINKDA